MQIETAEALSQLEGISAVAGVDGVFIGPADLAASLDHAGDPGHPEVVAVIEDAIGRVGKCGKPVGILTPDPVFAKRCMQLGTVGVDIGILARGGENLARQFNHDS